MNFDHDNQIGPELAVDLVNADTQDDLEPILRRHAIRRPTLDPYDDTALRRWAQRLRSAFEADSTDELCATVNSLLDEAAGRMYLTTHDGLRPHLHLTSDDEHVVARVKAVTAGGLALMAAWTGGTRIGTCARDNCDRVFIDTSRGGRRRYCSARCGNTDAVIRHRVNGRTSDRLR